MNDALLKKGMKYLKSYIVTEYPALKIDDYLIQKDNIVIVINGKKNNLVLPELKFRQAISQFFWTTDDLKNFLDKDRNEILKDRQLLIQEINSQLS